ncbi:MAG: AAA family ATPase [Candidatus Latescibacteria bacterium]|nr:AAA family ATPase [bacterium]MBD3423902.1 AAA family ATPase [Candidatus Latescibacterota bacterium]
MNDLFNREDISPLAERMRPRTLEEFQGQNDIVGKGKVLQRILSRGKLESSLIFWGPPGCGKTTLAHIIANSMDARFVFFSAVTSGIAEVRRIIAEAGSILKMNGKRTILFVDEIHRFNKAQQDAFLPHIESGTVVLIGATTENPSFEVISPLLSRSRVFILKALEADDIAEIVRDALADKERGFGLMDTAISDDALDYLSTFSFGDARTALNTLEMAVESYGEQEAGLTITREIIEECMQKKNILYDKDGEQHFNLISALHKSLRGSDPDASLYWLARMLEGGEEPLYIARRLVRFASEDIGNADPEALGLSINMMEAVRFLGLPECKLALAQSVLYLATAPKSNSVYSAYGKAAADVKKHGPLPVPVWLRNAPTSFMKDIGYGKDYIYPHNQPDAVADQEYFPEDLAGSIYYRPVKRGFEREIIKRIRYWRSLREVSNKDKE